jgi:hypothetical protein
MAKPREVNPDDGLATAESQAAAEAVAEADQAVDSGEKSAPSRRRRPVGPGRASATAESAEARTDRIEVTQGGIQDARADRIDVKQGGIMRAEANEISLTQGGLGLAKAGRVSIQMGGLGAALADHVELHQAVGRLIGARVSARLDQAGALAIVAGRVEMGPQSGACVVISPRVDGPVRTLLDWRGALVFGAAFAVVSSLLRAILPFGRKRDS